MKPTRRRSSVRLRPLVVLLAASTLFLPAGVRPDWVKLNGPLVRPTYASITNHALAPDGSQVLYRADLDVDERFELYASPTDGSGGSLRLSAPMLTPEGDVTIFRIAPGGAHAVYRADAVQDGRDELFSVPLDGSAAPVRLNGPLTPGGDVNAFEISADGLRVAYLADQETDGVNELFGVPIDRSSPPARLNGPLVSGGDVLDEDFLLTADGSRVVYLADQETDGVLELYSSDGVHPPVKLNAPLVLGGDVGGSLGRDRLDITPDGARVVYLADQEIDNKVQVYSVPIDGSQSPVRLDPALPGQSFVSFRIAPDAQRVAFEGSGVLYTAPIDGSTAAVQFTSSLSDPFSGRTYEISPDSARVVYRADFSGVDQLYSAPIDRSAAPVWLSAPLDAGGVYDFRIDVLSERVAFHFLADTPSSDPDRLASVPVDGSEPAVLLSAPGHSGVTVGDFACAGQRVLYLSDQDSWQVFGLYSAPGDGSAPAVLLSGPMVAQGDATQFQSSADGNLVLYAADQERDSVYELFVAPADGSTPSLKVNDALPAGPPAGDVANLYAISPDASRVVYVADQEEDGLFEVFSVPIDASSAPVNLDGGPVATIALTPDGARVVHVRVSEETEVFSSPIDGSTPATWLAVLPPFIGEFNSVTLLVSPDSQHVLYRLNSFSFPNLIRGPVHSVPVDGSRPAIQLSSSSCSRFAIDSSSRFAVYLQGPELYSRRLDGSAPAVKLNGTLVAGGQVSEFEITPDGQRVLYRADQRKDQLFELFSTSIDGHVRVLVLNGPAVGAGVTSFEVSADSSLAVFSQETPVGRRLFSRVTDASAAPLELASLEDESPVLELSTLGRAVYTDSAHTRLLSVPVDGSAPSVELSDAADDDFRISPDGVWVVSTGSSGLSGVRVDGSAAPIALGSLHAVLRFAITDDSSAVVAIDGGKLYWMPIDGSAHPVTLNGPLTARGRVDSFQIASDSRTVVYRADQEMDEVYELFATRFRRSILPAPRPSRSFPIRED